MGSIKATSLTVEQAVELGLPVKKIVRVPSGRAISIEDDIEFGVLAAIAEEHSLNVFLLTVHPVGLGTGGAGLAMYKAACEAAGEQVPAKLSLATIRDAFETVLGDDPSLWIDGLPPTGAQTTA